MDGISNGDILTASVTAVSIAGGAIFAYFQLKTHRQIATDRAEQERTLAAQKVTLDFISDYELHSKEWLDVRKVFASLRASNALATIVQPANQAAWENKIQVTTFLNHFELVAIAIKHRIIDEKLYAEWWRSSLVRAWRDAEGFVVELRRDRNEKSTHSGDRIYKPLEDLALKWEKEIKQEDLLKHT